MSEREIYRFPSGELLPEHCRAFGEALCNVLLREDAPVCVVLALGSVPDALPALGADGYDASSDCALVDYGSRSKLVSGLWPLFMGAEPELFFTRSDAFASAVQRVRDYGAAEIEARRARGEQPFWRRLHTPAPRVAIEQTSLVRAYAPVILHRPDGVCSVVTAAS